MRQEKAGITRAPDALDGVTWTILGQTYVPKTITADQFSWHATFPPGTFVPPHVHPNQDEYLYILTGTLDFWLDGDEVQAATGDTVRLERGKPHGIFNKSGEPATCMFWVAPTGTLPALFTGIHEMAEQSPDAVVALAARHDIHFLPPPA